MKLAFTGDWHLGCARSKLDPETGLNSRLLDFYRCARFTIDDSVSRGAQIILHGGDIFQGCRPTPSERRYAVESFTAAREQGVPVLIVRGNHDSPRSPSEKDALDTLREVSGLVIVGQPQMLDVWRDGSKLRVSEPASEQQRQFGDTTELQIACAPYPNKQLLLKDAEHRKLDAGQLNLLLQEKMLDVLRGLAANRIPGIPAVLVCHFSLDTAEAGSQNRLMMLGGDFTLSVHDLAALGFDAVLVAHIHKPQTLHENPWIGYCGSPEACNHGEEGEEKSYCLLDIAGPGDVRVERIPTPFRKFVTLDLSTLDESGLQDPEQLCDAIVRVKLPATADVNLVELRRQLEAAGAWEYQIETERAETVRRRSAEISAEMALEGALDAYIAQRPELKPMRESLLSEAQEIERDLVGGAA